MKTQNQFFVCMHVKLCSRSLIIAYICVDCELIYPSTSTVKETSETLEKIDSSDTFVVDLIPRLISVKPKKKVPRKKHFAHHGYLPR